MSELKTKELIEKIKKNIVTHLNPYNLGDMGETVELIYDALERLEGFGKPALADSVDCMNCYECLKDKKEENGLSTVLTRMIVCPICGNKRCPKATDHNLECTHSNESGQAGSRY